MDGTKHPMRNFLAEYGLTIVVDLRNKYLKVQKAAATLEEMQVKAAHQHLEPTQNPITNQIWEEIANFQFSKAPNMPGFKRINNSLEKEPSTRSNAFTILQKYVANVNTGIHTEKCFNPIRISVSEEVSVNMQTRMKKFIPLTCFSKVYYLTKCNRTYDRKEGNLILEEGTLKVREKCIKASKESIQIIEEWKDNMTHAREVIPKKLDIGDSKEGPVMKYMVSHIPTSNNSEYRETEEAEEARESIYGFDICSLKKPDKTIPTPLSNNSRNLILLHHQPKEGKEQWRWTFAAWHADQMNALSCNTPKQNQNPSSPGIEPNGVTRMTRATALGTMHWVWKSMLEDTSTLNEYVNIPAGIEDRFLIGLENFKLT
ncbi:hypothetical protein ARMSODRAFT_974269 [Armillaria solidipes]|uniref:Uncharacterized protein n=1 Tax=Armillaria solidipes TaxID=1076256 RepID=A0A2H3C0D7_9AGAR|nr:hypothetical protein ARMSODRAFT_974269 [Armillaria solidipes]